MPTKTPKVTKYYGITGRIPEDNNLSFTCEATSKAKAIAQFRAWIWRDSTHKERTSICNLHGCSLYIESCFESDSPIHVVE